MRKCHEPSGVSAPRNGRRKSAPSWYSRWPCASSLWCMPCGWDRSRSRFIGAFFSDRYVTNDLRLSVFPYLKKDEVHMNLNAVLFGVFAVLLVVYLMKRKSRLNKG